MMASNKSSRTPKSVQCMAMCFNQKAKKCVCQHKGWYPPSWNPNTLKALHHAVVLNVYPVHMSVKYS